MRKLTILLGAVSLFAMSAHAQYRPLVVAAPAGVGTAPTQTAPTGPGATRTAPARPAVGSTSPYVNDSYVEQVGTNQMANVEQSGTGKNTADILQSSSSLSTGGNYASQKQESVASTYNAPVDNQANIQQYGTGSTAIQEQRGVQNAANIQQGSTGTSSSANYASQKQSSSPGTAPTNGNKANILQNTTSSGSGNSATQTQSSSGNNALADQQGSNNTSVQNQGPADSEQGTVTQSGNDNYAEQNQRGGSNIAEITQPGSNNEAYQNQNGFGSKARIVQNSDGNVAQQTQANGPNNFAETIQGGNPSFPGASYSNINQNGTMNSALVKQNAQ
jgi:hypothetical protein